VPSHFYGYVSVPDVDAAAEVAAKAGGKVLAPAMDIPNVGRFAILQDPQGGVFALLRSLHGDPDQNRIPGNGEFCWDSLHTSDINGAISFYNKVIGWTTKPGPEGMTGGVFMQGDLMEASYDGLPMPEVPTHWMTNIAVNDLKASVKKAQELGATILMDGIEIPFGTFSVVRDPQGAHFAMFQGKQQ